MQDSMRIDTPTTQKVAGTTRAPVPFSSPWMDIERSSAGIQGHNASRTHSNTQSTSPASSISTNINTTTINNEHKPITYNEERLERRMTDLSLMTDTKSSMYQEHVCAEDFYKQPRVVYENVVVVEKSIVETQALGNRETVGGENEDGARRGSSSWRFESEVLWNEGGRGGYYENSTGGDKRVETEMVEGSTLRVETQSTEQTRRVEGLQNERLSAGAKTKMENSNGGVRERGEGFKSGRGQETTIPATPPDQGGPPTSSSQQSMINSLETEDQDSAVNQSIPQKPIKEPIGPDGNEIRKRLESDNGGWKFAFELFELGKVPDSQSFLVDVLEEFINRRPQYWAGLQKQGFNVDRYRKSDDDDDLFLQISYTDAALQSLQKGDTIRALELILKILPVLNRRIAKGRSWILNIEVIEVIILLLYIPLKHSKQPLLKSLEEGNNIFNKIQITELVDVDCFIRLASERTAVGLKWCFQLHFLFTMLLEVDQRYSYASNKWRLWLDGLADSKHLREPLRRIVVKMFGIEALRYETEEAITGSRSNWNWRQGVRWLRNVSAAHLSLFASTGHKEMILENMETLYNLETAVGWDGKTLPPPSPKITRLPEIQSVLQVLPQAWGQSPLDKYSEMQVPGPVETVGNRGTSGPLAPPRRQGSIRHPSPWESGLSSSSSSQAQHRDQSIPESRTPVSPKGPLSPTRSPNNPYRAGGRDSATSPSVNTSTSSISPPRYSPLPNARTGPPTKDKSLKSQRLANLRDQPVRHADDCKDEEFAALTDYKQAIRQSQNLDVFIGTLASLRLINFISGDPEYRPWTPLIEAICNQRWEAAKALIRLGASFDVGYPFHTALSRHFMAGSRSRCEKMVEIKLITTGGLSADQYFFNESKSLIEYMIAAGADVNALGTANTDLATQMKTYPLHLAALDPVPTSPLVQDLLELGASVWATDANGKSALEYARRAKNSYTIRLLEEAMMHSFSYS
ncbi:hypothetical protein TWF506_008232 [Arthrobotrys conoides]|uniref:Ankyrin repeat protein n=1 Tax=Arthrobotrys conoides TaxID=74498 RepID=A0AAN8RTQ4_9PEZI